MTVYEPRDRELDDLLCDAVDAWQRKAGKLPSIFLNSEVGAKLAGYLPHDSLIAILLRAGIPREVIARAGVAAERKLAKIRAKGDKVDHDVLDLRDRAAREMRGDPVVCWDDMTVEAQESALRDM